MSAQDNLSQELFFEAHRGEEKVRPEKLGIHWSAGTPIAYGFALEKMFDERRSGSGRIIHGRIPISSVETDPKVLKEHGVDNDTYWNEDEVTAKSGAPVTVTGVSNIRVPRSGGPTKLRKRTYNPPREMKA